MSHSLPQLFLVVLAATAVACGSDKDEDRTSTLTDDPADADTDTDVDSDTDSDADVDTAPTGDTGKTIGSDSIFDIQGGKFKEGATVDVRGVVTGVAADGLFLQDPKGGPRSGIWVFLGTSWEKRWGTAQRGDALEVEGTYQEYFDQSQIDASAKAGSAVTLLGKDSEPPAQVVDMAQLAKDPEPWEGVLITLADLTVTQPDAGPGDFEVSDANGASWIVGDRCYRYGSEATIEAKDAFDAITGVLDFVFTAYQIQPRSGADILAVPASTGHTGTVADTSPPTGSTAETGYPPAPPAPTGDTGPTSP